MNKPKLSSTNCVHAGRSVHESAGSLTPPIVHSAPFSFESTRELLDFLEGRSSRTQPEYGRMGNPTIRYVEKRLAALEGVEETRLFSSGMAAVTTLFLSLLRSGDHIVLTRDSYRRIRDFGSFLGKFGVNSSIADCSTQAIESALRPETRLVFTEVPTNPYLNFVDLEKLVLLTRPRSILSVVDSTFATPINLRPSEFGVDLIVQSATKYLGGHNDLIAGVLSGSADLVRPVADMLMTLGTISDASTAFLLNRGLKSLSLRMERQNVTGERVARFLEAHPRISRVFYPGLESHPHHEIARKYMSGFGGVVSFEVDGDFHETAHFLDRLEIPHLAPSLGGVESMVEQVAVMSYWNLPPEERLKLGIPDNLVRLSVGIEEAEDLISDLQQALG